MEPSGAVFAYVVRLWCLLSNLSSRDLPVALVCQTWRLHTCGAELLAEVKSLGRMLQGQAGVVDAILTRSSPNARQSTVARGRHNQMRQLHRPGPRVLSTLAQ